MDSVDISSFDTQGRAREGAEERLAYRRPNRKRSLVVQIVPFICASGLQPGGVGERILHGRATPGEGRCEGLGSMGGKSEVEG